MGPLNMFITAAVDTPVAIKITLLYMDTQIFYVYNHDEKIYTIS